VLGLVLRGAVNKSASSYLQERVWEPIGTEADAMWLLDAEAFEVAHFGFNAVLRDYARLGRLFAHDGAWQGKQIIPAQWMIDATTVRPSDAYLLPGKAMAPQPFPSATGICCGCSPVSGVSSPWLAPSDSA